MDSVRWDRLGDAAWLLLGMREAADGRKCKTYMPDTLFLDAVSSLEGGPAGCCSLSGWCGALCCRRADGVLLRLLRKPGAGT